MVPYLVRLDQSGRETRVIEKGQHNIFNTSAIDFPPIREQLTRGWGEDTFSMSRRRADRKAQNFAILVEWPVKINRTRTTIEDFNTNFQG